MITLSLHNKVRCAFVIAPSAAAVAVLAASAGAYPIAVVLTYVAVRVVTSTQRAIRKNKTIDPLSAANQFTIAKLTRELEGFDSSRPHNKRKSDPKNTVLAEVRQALLQRA